MTPTDLAGTVLSINELANNRGFQAEVAQIRAKAVLTELIRKPPEYRWTYIPNRVVKNLAAVSHDIQLFAARSPGSVQDLERPALRFAHAWESLSILQEGATRSAALLNAAAAYEIAGYQANAACLTRKITPDPRRLDYPSITDLVSL